MCVRSIMKGAIAAPAQNWFNLHRSRFYLFLFVSENPQKVGLLIDYPPPPSPDLKPHPHSNTSHNPHRKPAYTGPKSPKLSERCSARGELFCRSFAGHPKKLSEHMRTTKIKYNCIPVHSIVKSLGDSSDLIPMKAVNTAGEIFRTERWTHPSGAPAISR